MGGRKLRSVVNWQGALKQKDVKQTGVKQGLGVVKQTGVKQGLGVRIHICG